MAAAGRRSGTETYTLVLTDSTQGWTQTITENESGVSRSSAEVITGRCAGTVALALLLQPVHG